MAGKLKMRTGPTGTTVWNLPGSELEVLWSGPGGRLLIGQATKAGGSVSPIHHHTADGNYLTRKEAESALRRFLETE